MNELKVYHCNEWHNEYTEFYQKSEADKVIADKDAEIAQLQAMLEERNKQVGELKDRIAPKQANKTLQERLNEVCEKHGVSTLQDLDWAFCESEKRHTKDNIEAVKEIEHHKYKRCLDKAKQCEEKCRGLGNSVIRCSTYPYMSTCPTDCDPRYTFFKRWRKRWLEIAEYFKEAK